MFYGDTKEVKEEKAMRKHYSHDGLQEITDNMVSGETTFVTYLGGDGYSAPIVLKGDGTTKEYLYLHRDYQGSIMAISNDQGNIAEERLYDAWGLVKAVKDGQGNNLTKLTILDRGYTGHEHLQGVGLIHMNARLYDPVVHRFMGPDNYVVDPSNTQTYNRYGYVMNNPLKYTDPSGENPIVVAMIIAASVSATMYTVNCVINNQAITLQGFMGSAITGAISGAFTFGIGTATSTIANFYVRAAVQAVAHGTFQGGMSEAQGGTFAQGFASGALSSLAASAFSGGQHLGSDGTPLECTGWAGAGKFAKNDFGMIAFGTVSGGLGAELAGGNFWQGAATGLIVSALNHHIHNKQQQNHEEGLKEYYAIVAGESSNDITEAQGIGEVILRRLELKGKSIDKGFVKHIGGKSQFDAVDGPIYNEVMKMDLNSIVKSNQNHKYHNRFVGATTARVFKTNITNGAYFWNASSPKKGFNWNMVNNKTFTITAEFGKTTFFKYSNSNKQWP